MKTVTELLKERMQIRTTDPDRSNIIMMVVDGAKKLAKEAGRDPGTEDLSASVKSQIKQTEKALNQIKENGGDFTQWEKDLAILRSFLPPALTEDELKAEIEKMVLTLPESEQNRKSQGKIMAILKKMDNVDMGLAGKILTSRLG